MTAPPLARLVAPRDLEPLRAQHPEIQLLDVRTPGEFEAVHVKGAYNVPLGLLSEHAAEFAAGVRGPVVLICQSGGRATQAHRSLHQAGHQSLYVLEGGMNGWISANLPAVRRVPRMSLERQVRIAAGTLVAIGSGLALVVHPLIALLPLFIGSGLVFSGVTDTCGMGLLISKLPWNRGPKCDIDAAIRALANTT